MAYDERLADRIRRAIPSGPEEASFKPSSAGRAMTESAPFIVFPEATLQFLRGITNNNDRAWFDAHCADDEAGYVEPAKAFVTALGPRLRKLASGRAVAPEGHRRRRQANDPGETEAREDQDRADDR